MKKIYIAPDAERCRVFLEEGIAAKASIMLSGAGNIQQSDWTGITEEPAGVGTDPQGDMWFVY
jgi:hypothetical protein